MLTFGPCRLCPTLQRDIDAADLHRLDQSQDQKASEHCGLRIARSTSTSHNRVDRAPEKDDRLSEPDAQIVLA